MKSIVFVKTEINHFKGLRIQAIEYNVLLFTFLSPHLGGKVVSQNTNFVFDSCV